MSTIHTNLNGYAPSLNGHDHPANGHEVSYDPQQVTLPWGERLPAKEQDVPTAKKDSPVAETAKKEKTKRIYAGSIINTLTHCGVFISAATNCGPNYRSNKPLYELTNLRSMQAHGYELVKAVDKTNTKEKYAVAFRKDEFDGLQALCALVIAEMLMSDVSEVTIEQLRTIMRLLRGERKVAKDPKNPMANYRSVSQQNYDDVVANFAKLILMVAEEENYDPPVDELKLTSLEAKLVALTTANVNAMEAEAEANAARMARNEFFNAKGTGLVDVFITAKKVILVNFGRKSEQFAKVKGLSFKKIKVR